MGTCYEDLEKNLYNFMEKYGKENAGVMEGFAKLHKENAKDGAISGKNKELMSLAIGIAVHCDGCIACHTRDALRAGASRQEIVETIGVAILMGGGPSVVYGSKAMEAMEEFNGNS